MARRHHHYERAVERFIRFHRIPYVSVNEARRTLLASDPRGTSALKSFDFVLYGHPNLFVEVKGRRVGPGGRLDPWATRQDVEDLLTWESLFAGGFRARLLFAFWFDTPPTRQQSADRTALAFEDIFEHNARWYALRTIDAADFAAHMTTRSRRWDTVQIPTALFRALSTDLLGTSAPPLGAREPRDAAGGTVLHRFGVPSCG